MHERNIYKIPHNFAELARKHEFLAPFLSLVNDTKPINIEIIVKLCLLLH